MNEPTNCPKCNINLCGEDIYQYFYRRYLEYGIPTYSRPLDEIKKAIVDYPSLYKDAPVTEDLEKMSSLELAAWESAQSHGWSMEKPVTFKRECAIEIRGYYDGAALYRCPYCNHVWKRFSWVTDEVLKEYLDGVANK